MAQWAIRYYRSQEWAEAFARIGKSKPAGMVTSWYSSVDKASALATAQHINELCGPEQLCTVVEVNR